MKRTIDIIEHANQQSKQATIQMRLRFFLSTSINIQVNSICLNSMVFLWWILSMRTARDIFLVYILWVGERTERILWNHMEFVWQEIKINVDY